MQSDHAGSPPPGSADYESGAALVKREPTRYPAPHDRAGSSIRAHRQEPVPGEGRVRAGPVARWLVAVFLVFGVGTGVVVEPVDDDERPAAPPPVLSETIDPGWVALDDLAVDELTSDPGKAALAPTAAVALGASTLGALLMRAARHRAAGWPGAAATPRPPPGPPAPLRPAVLPAPPASCPLIPSRPPRPVRYNARSRAGVRPLVGSPPRAARAAQRTDHPHRRNAHETALDRDRNRPRGSLRRPGPRWRMPAASAADGPPGRQPGRQRVVPGQGNDEGGPDAAPAGQARRVGGQVRRGGESHRSDARAQEVGHLRRPGHGPSGHVPGAAARPHGVG